METVIKTTIRFAITVGLMYVSYKVGKGVGWVKGIIDVVKIASEE